MAATTLGFALLGLLARRPMTGYQLAAALKTPIGYFWSASHSQVYPELARLEAQGLVRHEVIGGPGPRDNKRYHPTQRGRSELGAWAGTPAPAMPADNRDEFLLKIYSSWLADPRAAAAMVARRRDEHRAMLDRYREIRAENERTRAAEIDDPTTPEFANYATVMAGISYEEHVIAWCDWLIGRIGAGAAPPADDSRR